jgi:dienelactone hydrolase
MIFLLVTVVSTEAAVETRFVEYSANGVTFEGYVAYDDAVEDQRPGILIVHAWNGLGEYEQMRARMLAEMGYVAFALDIYGGGVRPASNQEASQEAGKYYNDRNLFRSRLKLGLDQLKSLAKVDTMRLGAIGYCFGGGGALELARSGADLKGVVSFHGSLSTPLPAQKNSLKARILVCHGAADPFVPSDDVLAFQKEMDDAEADWQLIMYGHAVHSFTHKSAGDDPSQGAAYNEKADRRSWEAMKAFFEELF